MTLINAIISSPEDLDFRLHLRNEFMRIGLLDVLEVTENQRTFTLKLLFALFSTIHNNNFSSTN